LTVVEQIKILEELAQIDAELKIMADELSREHGALGTRKASLQKLEEKLKNDRAQLSAIEKLKNDYVIEVRTMMQQIEHSRDKMNRSRTERETNAVQRELEELRKLMRDREDEVGKLTTDAENAKRNIETTETEAKAIAAELGTTEGAITSKLGQLEAAHAEKSKQRAEIVKRVQPISFKRYEMVRIKRGTGLASTTDGTCKACNMSLPPQLFHKLRREALIEQCPSCNRLIYFVAPTPAAAPEAKG
jgi:uncharacterized protein